MTAAVEWASSLLQATVWSTASLLIRRPEQLGLG